MGLYLETELSFIATMLFVPITDLFVNFQLLAVATSTHCVVNAWNDADG